MHDLLGEHQTAAATTSISNRALDQTARTPVMDVFIAERDVKLVHTAVSISLGIYVKSPAIATAMTKSPDDQQG